MCIHNMITDPPSNQADWYKNLIQFQYENKTIQNLENTLYYINLNSDNSPFSELLSRI